MLQSRTLLALTAGLSLAACSDNNGSPIVRTFTVTVQNVSTPNTVPTARAMGTVPLSPGTYAVFTGSDPSFTVGSPADIGTERIAEDGFPGPPIPLGTKSTMLAAARNVRTSGVFLSPGGPGGTPGVFAGETATFTVTASPGERLQIMTMFVQSNDWFYAFGSGGLELFSGDTPVNGDVTSRIVLYDAGTEMDTAPGTGPNQKPVQGPMDTNIGPPDANTLIRIAGGFPIPPTASVIRVTITPSN